MSAPQSPTIEAGRQTLPASLLHDLRTPLNQIIGYSALLMEQAQEQGQHSFVPDLEKTQVAGQELLALINNHFQSISGPVTPAPYPLKSEPTSKEITDASVAGEPTSAAAQGFVLVVDDIEANRDVLSRRLKRQGYTVATAQNGRLALERLRADTFDLVLLDIMMPEMDGYEVLQHLKADPVLRRIPVIVISALSEMDSVVRCIELGAEDYLPKPFNPTLLKARTGACLEKKRARDREAHLFAQLQENHLRVQLLNAEMARWREAHEADLAVARTTQRALIASALPTPEGWQVEAVHTPLIQVGGDVYGWRQLDRGVWVFWLADATGHGVAAALLTTLVAWLFDHASASCSTAHGILARVNEEFSKVLRGNSFMTACCAVIDREGRLSFAGAGHPPLLIRRSDGVVEELPSLNTMMGLHPEMKVGVTVATLAAGDVALLYSDGLHSLKAKDSERFTHLAVARALTQIDASADLLPRVIAQLVQGSDAQPFEDDLAAIAVRRE